MTLELGQTSPQSRSPLPQPLASDGSNCHGKSSLQRCRAVGRCQCRGRGHPGVHPGKLPPTGVSAWSVLVETKVYIICSSQHPHGDQEPLLGVFTRLQSRGSIFTRMEVLPAPGVWNRTGSEPELLGSSQRRSQLGQKTSASPERGAGDWGTRRLRSQCRPREPRPHHLPPVLSVGLSDSDSEACNRGGLTPPVRSQLTSRMFCEQGLSPCGSRTT